MAPTTSVGTAARFEKLRLEALSAVDSLQKAAASRRALIHSAIAHDAAPEAEDFYFDPSTQRVETIAVRLPSYTLAGFARELHKLNR